MKKIWEKLNSKTTLTIGAECAAILTVILTLIMYFDVKNATPTNPSGVLTINPFLIGIIVVNGILFVFFFVTVIRSVYVYLNGKSYQLGEKLKTFIKSDSEYLHKLRVDDTKAERQLIEKTENSVKSINRNKAFDQDSYYMLLYALFHTADGTINVVSILDDNEWVDTPEEDEFLRVNIAVAERKVHLNRIFVVNESEVKEKLKNKSIQSFINADHTYIHLFVIFDNKLPRNIINDIGSGFIDFHGFAIACDIFSDNEIRGTLKFESVEVDHYNRIYMRLSEYYQPLNSDFVRQYLS